MPILDRLSGGLLQARAAQAVAARNAALFDGDVYQPQTDHVPASGHAITCAAEGCTSGWLKPWKNRRRPIFEEDWGCSGRCLQTLVRSAVRREVGEGSAAETTTQHRHRVPLGLVLLAQGWITHPQLQAALEAQRSSGQGRIGDWLMQSCGLPAERVTRGLGVQWSCPVLAMDGFSPAAMALVMPKRFLSEFGMVPLRVAGSSLLYVAFADRMDAATTLGVEQMCGLKVQSGLLGSAELESARAAVLAADGINTTCTSVSDADALTSSIVRALEQRQPVASRLVRVHQYYWLRLWLESGARSGIGELPTGAEDVQDMLFTVGQ